MSDKVTLTPKSTVGDLMEAYPFLIDSMIELNPHFKNLANPVMLRTMAKRATLEHGASVAGIPIEQMLDHLRKSLEANGVDCEVSI